MTTEAFERDGGLVLGSTLTGAPFAELTPNPVHTSTWLHPVEPDVFAMRPPGASTRPSTTARERIRWFSTESVPR